MPILKSQNGLPRRKRNKIMEYIMTPFKLILSCLMASLFLFKAQIRILKKKTKPNKKYHRITFNTTNNNNEIAKIQMPSAKSAKERKTTENNTDLFSPNLSETAKNSHHKLDTIITIPKEEKKADVFQKVLNNLGRSSNSRRHIIFQKIVYGNNAVLKKKSVMPGTDSALNKFMEVNKKFIDELKPDEMLLRSKSLEDVLIEKLHQPMILRSKKIVIKCKPKKKSFIPSNLTTIYEDVDYCQ